MMTHGNVLATVSAVMTIVPDLGKRDTYMAYLPLAHILELAAEVSSNFIALCVSSLTLNAFVEYELSIVVLECDGYYWECYWIWISLDAH